MTLATAYLNKIDALWLDFHSGGITNPITVIEQISYLMFARLLDITESRKEKRAGRLKKDFKRLFPEDKQHIRWSHFRNEGGDRMLTIVRDEFFPVSHARPPAGSGAFRRGNLSRRRRSVEAKTRVGEGA